MITIISATTTDPPPTQADSATPGSAITQSDSPVTDKTISPLTTENSVQGPSANASESFKKEEQLTNILAELDESDKKAIGYQPREFLVDCQFEGFDCRPE